jgi:2'-5' RNA ligase
MTLSVRTLAVALLFPADVGARIDAIRERFGTPHVREVVPHITLKQPFRPRVQAEVLAARLHLMAETTLPFTMVLDGFDYFEGEQSLAYIALRDPKPVWDLHSQVVRSLQGLTEGGDEYDLDRFVPHATINDSIPRGRLPSFKSELAACTFHAKVAVDSFVLFGNEGDGWKTVNDFHLLGK